MGAYITTRAENARHRRRLAFECGMREWEKQLERAKDIKKALPDEKVAVASSVTFLCFYVGLAELMERGRPTPDAIKKLLQERDQINKVFDWSAPPWA